MNSLVVMGVALVTPFKSDLTIDHDALAKIVEFNIENGTDYLVISGTTGESVTITKDEKREIVETIIKANAGRLPLVIGIGGNNTAAVVEELKSTDLSPFTAVLSVAPYYSKPTQEGIYQHFKAVAQASSIPVILYNVPGRTAKNMEPETSLRLAQDFDNIVAIKEAGNNPEQYKTLLKNKPHDFLIISGDDDLVCDVVLAGGSGVLLLTACTRFTSPLYKKDTLLVSSVNTGTRTFWSSGLNISLLLCKYVLLNSLLIPSSKYP